jgi:hypothetical protein
MRGRISTHQRTNVDIGEDDFDKGGHEFYTGGDRTRRKRENLIEFAGSSDECIRKRDQED